MNRTTLVSLVSLALLAVFAVIAVSVVNGRRPLERKMTQSFGTAASIAAGTRASVVAPACEKVSVEFFSCSASVTPRRRTTSVYVTYNVWLDDDGCWDTKRRTHKRQSPALGRLRLGFDSLRGCLAH